VGRAHGVHRGNLFGNIRQSIVALGKTPALHEA
jgi:hypothetical protein